MLRNKRKAEALRRMLRFVTIALLLVIGLSTVCLAHPGKTDDSGGHVDNSTGEYHYHHGYSAHYHFDMDDDGIIDCPHDFDDKTGENSGDSVGGGYDSPTKKTKKTYKAEKKGSFWDDEDALFLVTMLALVFLSLLWKFFEFLYLNWKSLCRFFSRCKKAVGKVWISIKNSDVIRCIFSDVANYILKAVIASAVLFLIAFIASKFVD